MDQLNNPGINSILEHLGLMRVVAVLAEHRSYEEQMILIKGAQTYINRTIAELDGEDFTREETHNFIFTDVLQSEDPFEAAYILQQKILAKTAAHPEKFRDPDPLRTVQDIRGFTSKQREAYLAGLKSGL